MKPEDLKDATKILQKYKDTTPADLMDEINDRIGALFLKLADMDANETEERAVIDTFLIWLTDTTKKLTEARKMLKAYPTSR